MFRFSFDAAGLAPGVAPGVILCVADGAQDATPRVSGEVLQFLSLVPSLLHLSGKASLSLHTDPTDVEVPN